MREIVLDTETTGINPKDNKIVEIACLELSNRCPTGNYWQCYLNPEREVPIEAYRVHGLDYEFLSSKPLFSDKVNEFIEFIQNSPLIIHNAPFDLSFLNTELSRCNKASISNPVVDTLLMARKKYPGSPASLDALCKRYNINNARRTLHGALLDTELLAEVYLELTGGRQTTLEIKSNTSKNGRSNLNESQVIHDTSIKSPAIKANSDELDKHNSAIQLLGEKSIWKNLHLV